jgi:hypothetical protein
MTCLLALAAAIAVNTSANPFVTPAIANHGKVVRLPDAAEQPRDGAKIVVDLTAGGSREKLNAAVEKVARYVNIYAGAGRKPATVRITVVLHGEATAVALSDAAYGKRFKTRGNPNLPLIRKLKKAGVEFFVCGQALAHMKFAPAEVAGELPIAVSALTVNVNRQQQEYAYVPLH